MEDIEVCPLCCEELDISDQQFFPCKCGYQVCMWCWHRIKEQETGLCPACRTPYGDDPHEFSAVDMEEVLKANKEKAAAEKREKERLRLTQGASASGLSSMHISGGSDGDQALVSSHPDPPKDRNQLANMRVIRRNLVYAVGLPPSIVTEDTLRKPEYFGQYGKIAKIVVNRNHNSTGDPRRATASAYVTFAHPEDALACILALDGFYMDGRNIRASYGTSKYCSAFIKNVRCNNPECTYLHCMGDSEDTFTKQEIQAGYVTSGRDVLARQQQLAAASAGPNPRRRIGSPSGTGKVTSNPIFPQPTYDEPSKASQTNLVPPPPPATNSTTQFPTIGAATSMQRTASLNAPSSAISQLNSASKPIRASSLPNVEDSSLTPAEILSRQQEELRRRHPQNNGGATRTKDEASDEMHSERRMQTATNANAAPTAASVLAGVHTTTRPSQPAPHTTLTALTPLTRSKSLIDKKEPSKLTTLRSNSSIQPTTNDVFPSDKVSSIGQNGFGTIVGNTISQSMPLAAPSPIGAPIGGQNASGIHRSNENNLGSIGGASIGDSIGSRAHSIGTFGGSSLLFDGIDNKSKPSNGSDLLFNSMGNDIGLGGSELWDGNNTASSSKNDLLYGSPLKMGESSSGGLFRSGPGGETSGSSALASMLGIQLPSGAGSLRETLWASSTPLNPPSQENKSHTPTPIGSGIKKTNDNVIIGGPTRGNTGVPIGGYGSSAHSNGGNKSDIALLQSLLPGVHITSGNSDSYQPSQNVNGNHNPFAGSGWGGLGGTGSSGFQNLISEKNQSGDSWNNNNGSSSSNRFYSAAPGSQNQNSSKNQDHIW